LAVAAMVVSLKLVYRLADDQISKNSCPEVFP